VSVLRLRCAGVLFEAHVVPSGRGALVRLEGREVPVELRDLGDGAWEATVDGARWLVHAAWEGETLHLHARGRTYRFAPARAAAHRLAAAADTSAPMPGVVTRILVTPGQRVAEGEALYVLEAMKMETVVRSPRPGRVRRVRARAGEQVEGGAVVVELEEEG
jgi:biotin carboxyl carrier protein